VQIERIARGVYLKGVNNERGSGQTNFHNLEAQAGGRRKNIVRGKKERGVSRARKNAPQWSDHGVPHTLSPKGEASTEKRGRGSMRGFGRWRGITLREGGHVSPVNLGCSF